MLCSIVKMPSTTKLNKNEKGKLCGKEENLNKVNYKMLFMRRYIVTLFQFGLSIILVSLIFFLINLIRSKQYTTPFYISVLIVILISIILFSPKITRRLMGFKR